MALTPQQAQQIGEILNLKWNEIGYDCLAAIAEEKGKHVDRVLLSRRTVIELAMDQAYDEISGELRTAFDTLSYDGKLRAMRPFFPYTHYGT